MDAYVLLGSLLLVDSGEHLVTILAALQHRAPPPPSLSLSVSVCVSLRLSGHVTLRPNSLLRRSDSSNSEPSDLVLLMCEAGQTHMRPGTPPVCQSGHVTDSTWHYTGL
jgi:hypothetical protein